MIVKQWSDEDCAQLRKMFDEGMSAGQMCGHFGVTRNAIIGKLHRMGLHREKTISLKPKTITPARLPKPVRAAPVPAPAPAPKARGWNVATSTAEQIALANEVSSSLRAGWPKPRNPHSVTLFGLKQGACRFPLWGDDERRVENKFYCGLPAEIGRSYCAHCIPLTVGSGTPEERGAIASASKIAGVRL